MKYLNSFHLGELE